MALDMSLQPSYEGNVRELGLSSLVYVSRSLLSLDGDAPSVGNIVVAAIARNRGLRVTGALVYTELHFAQVLEGPMAAVRELMRSIMDDDRHSDVTIVAKQRISTRTFGAWSMAYNGPSPFLDRHIKPLFRIPYDSSQQGDLAERLLAKIRQLYQLDADGTTRGNPASKIVREQ